MKTTDSVNCSSQPRYSTCYNTCTKFSLCSDILRSIFCGELTFGTPPLLLFSASVDRGRMRLAVPLMTYSTFVTDWNKYADLARSYWPTFLTGTERDIERCGNLQIV